MSWTADPTPAKPQFRADSNAGRAYAVLSERGPLSSAALGEAIDVDRSALLACLDYPLRIGYLKKTKRDGLLYWEIGDGTPPPRPADEDAEDRPVQRVVPASTTKRPTPPPSPVVQTPAVQTPAPQAAPEAPPEPAPKAKAPRAKAAAPRAPKAPRRDLVPKAAPVVVTLAAQAHFGLFTDGRLVIEHGEQRIELASTDAQRLVRFIEGAAA